jgi:hypothetical protein
MLVKQKDSDIVTGMGTIESERTDAIELANQVTIVAATCSNRGDWDTLVVSSGSVPACRFRASAK